MEALNIKLFIDLLNYKNEEYDKLNEKFKYFDSVEMMSSDEIIEAMDNIELQIREIKSFMQAYISSGLSGEDKILFEKWLRKEYLGK